jgi:NAD-dependent deacetylase
MARAEAAARDCDVLITVGTSNVVWPAAQIPQYALLGGADVLVVNTDMTGQPEGERVLHLCGPAGEILPQLIELAWPRG